ncbi:hypothetical protein FF38_00455 [Lucilia cuprina]|uniref:Uncharacterized protein n=1 Tax=Lucilia cuprina TaxID=7375 RepID=A0A0L0BZP8_LUCCU|nr:hypothetical protein FF38_00455 [Lucilia cuprina]
MPDISSLQISKTDSEHTTPSKLKPPSISPSKDLRKREPVLVPAPLVHSKPRYKQVVNNVSPTKNRNKRHTSEQLRGILESNFDDGKGLDFEVEGVKIENFRLPGLKPVLLPHQVRGIKFMSTRERGRKYAKGGIIADEMGLGSGNVLYGGTLFNLTSRLVNSWIMNPRATSPQQVSEGQE